MTSKRLAKTQSPKRRFPITTKTTNVKQRRQTPLKSNYNKKDKDCGQVFRAETAKACSIRKKSNLTFRTGNNNVNNVNYKIAFLIYYTRLIIKFLLSFSSSQRNIRPAPLQDVITVSLVAYLLYFYLNHKTKDFMCCKCIFEFIFVHYIYNDSYKSSKLFTYS